MSSCQGPIRSMDDGALYCRDDYRRDISDYECPDCDGAGCERCGDGWIDLCAECWQVDELAGDFVREAANA